MDAHSHSRVWPKLTPVTLDRQQPSTPTSNSSRARSGSPPVAMSGRASSSRRSGAAKDMQTTPRARARPSANRTGRQSQPQRQQQSQQQQVDATPRRTAQGLLGDAPTPARSLSQPPPINVLRRSLAAQTPATPRRGGAAAGSSYNVATPGSAGGADRSMSIMASAKRAPGSARKRRFSSFGGWGTGREQSPMELLRRVARAYQLPPTPDVQARDISARDATSLGLSRATTGRSSGRRSNDRGSSSRGTMLRPGESIPGDLTRDVDLSVGEESSLSTSGELGRRIADGTPRSGSIFDSLAAQRRGHRESAASALNQSGRSSLRDDFSLGETTGVSARERQLEEKLLDLGPDASLDQLDEMARRHLFGNVSRMSTGSGRLDTTGDGDSDDDPDDSDAFGGFIDTSASRRSRAISEPAAPSADVSMDFAADQMPSFMEAVDADAQLSGSISRSQDRSRSDRSGALDRDSDELDEAAVDQGIQSASDISAQLRAEQVSLDSHSRSLVEDASMDRPSRSLEERANLSGSRSLEQEYDRSLEAEEGEEDDDLEDEEEDIDPDATLTPADRQIAQLAMLRRRSTKRRKSRVSPYTGNPVPSLPASFLSGLFGTFVTPASAMSSAAAFGAGAKNIKVEKAALDAVDDASHEFFATFSQKLADQATRSGRNATITEGDVVAVMKAEGFVTPRQSVSSLARRFLPKEFSDLVTPLPKSQGPAKIDKGKRKAGEAKRNKRDDTDPSAVGTSAGRGNGATSSKAKRHKK